MLYSVAVCKPIKKKCLKIIVTAYGQEKIFHNINISAKRNKYIVAYFI